MAVTESGMQFVFKKAKGLSYKHENFTNDSDKVWATVCVWWSFKPLLEISAKESVIEFVFSKVLGLY